MLNTCDACRCVQPLVATLCDRYSDRQTIICQGTTLHILPADTDTDWRALLGQLCLWALPRVSDEPTRRDLRRTLRDLESLDQGTCWQVLNLWTEELDIEGSVH